MADLDSNLQASTTTKVVGSDATGVEQTPVQSTTAGALHTNLRNATGTEIGTAAAPVRVDPTGTTTQPISAASLPLPTGASTAALQTTGNASLTSIDAKVVPTILTTQGLQATLVVGTTVVEVKVGASRLADRKLVTLDNTSNVVLYWGYSASTSTTNYAGRIFKDQQASWDIGPNVGIYVIAATAANSIHISEGA